MYTRVYQGKQKELPENYHGTAFSEFPEEVREEVREESAPAPPDAMGDAGMAFRGAAPCPDADAPCYGAACETEKKAQEKKEDGAKAFEAELLLLVICALLMESDAPDTRLLALLLLLLLSPT